MNGPKRRVYGFRDKVRVYSTRAGTQFVRPSDVILSKQAGEHLRIVGEIREAHEKQESSLNGKVKAKE